MSVQTSDDYCAYPAGSIDGDRDVFLKCVALAESTYSKGNADLKNAIDVSFVEELEFSPTKRGSYEWAWELLPDRLKELYIAFNGSSKI